MEISITLGIEKLATKVLEYMEKRSERRDNYLDILLDDIEMIKLIKIALDNDSNQLFLNYKDKDLLRNPDNRKQIAKLTDQYLSSMVLLPNFEELIDSVRDAAAQKELKTDEFRGLSDELLKLFENLESYRRSIGHAEKTGSKWSELKYMQWRIENINDINEESTQEKEINEVVKFANRVLETSDRALSTRINADIGTIKNRIRAIQLL